MLHAFAPAKINLYLHITGRREDGYHLLDSLVAFTNVGDRLALSPAKGFTLTIDGPQAGALAGDDVQDNLVTRAARALAARAGRNLDEVALTLTKNLPVASGIGGGSSDAAAALRLLAQHWEIEPENPWLAEIAAQLGADIPSCLALETCYFCDTGVVTEPGPDLPPCDIVLVNPGKGLSTPAVYKARQGAFQPPARLETAPQNVKELAGMLAQRGNGLTQAALSLMPEIGEILTALEAQSGCLLARMSGSGATCFGLYEDRSFARQAAGALMASHPHWWAQAAFLPWGKPKILPLDEI